MGYRAHVCTTYRVRYGTGCFSAAACDAVNRLLENYEYPDGDGGRKSLVEYCDAEETVMELSREGLGSLVASLENGEAPEETDASSTPDIQGRTSFPYSGSGWIPRTSQTAS